MAADAVEAERAAKAQSDRELMELKHRLDLEGVERRRMIDAAGMQQIIIKQQEELRVRAEQDQQAQLLANSLTPFLTASNAQLHNPNSCPPPQSQNALPDVPENFVSTTVSSTPDNNNSSVGVTFNQPIEEQTPASHPQPSLTDGQSRISSLKASSAKSHSATSTEVSGTESEENRSTGFQSVQTPNAT